MTAYIVPDEIPLRLCAVAYSAYRWCVMQFIRLPFILNFAFYILNLRAVSGRRSSVVSRLI